MPYSLAPRLFAAAPLALALLACGSWEPESGLAEPACPGGRDSDRSCVRPGRARGLSPQSAAERPDVDPAPSAGGGAPTPRAGSSGSRPTAGSAAPAAQGGAAGARPEAGSAGMVEPPPGRVPASAILVGMVENARDLGGVALANGAVVANGALFRGPPLAPFSDAACSEFERLGVRTILDLRIDSERASKPDAPCAQAQATVVHAPLPIPFSVSTQDYINDLYTYDSIALAFRALGDPDAYPIYFHCTWGRDRTGVLAAVILLALGADRDAILDEYLLSLDSVGAFPESLDGMIDEIEASGGIEAYLKAAGIPPKSVEALRARLTLNIP